MIEQEKDIFEDMFEETPFGKVDKAEFANAIAQETAEDIIWAWMSKNYQATIGDEKILFDALSKVWIKYKMYGLEKSVF